MTATAVPTAVVRQMRSHGQGSVSFHKASGLWAATVSLSDGKRRTKYGRSQAEARRKLIDMQYEARNGRPRLALAGRSVSIRGVPPKLSLRPLARSYALRAIEQGRIEGWSDEALAHVMVASVAPKRLKHGVFGPCAYCGDWTANTVDHVVPLSKGGADRPPNVVSCCESCNHRKQARTPEQWGVLAGNGNHKLPYYVIRPIRTRVKPV